MSENKSASLKIEYGPSEISRLIREDLESRGFSVQGVSWKGKANVEVAPDLPSTPRLFDSLFGYMPSIRGWKDSRTESELVLDSVTFYAKVDKPSKAEKP